MAVKGKTSCCLYLNRDTVDFIQDFLSASKRMPGWSEFVNLLLNDFALEIQGHVDDGTIGDFIEEWMIHK